jgi:flavin reductase (DIM6/NTAB) family NADH-FMN oxidoreductase RutF
MDMSVLWKLSYGMYAIGTLDGTRPTGCIVNTVAQITSDNPVIAVSMNKNNFTYEAIKKTGRLQFLSLRKRVIRM